MSTEWHKPMAMVITTTFALIQLRGIELGALVQEVATAMIGLAIIGFAIALIFVAAPGSAAHAPVEVHNSLSDWSLLVAAIIFTYDGWLYAAYFSGEIRGGAGAGARSCVRGMVIVIALYMLLNLALVKSVGLAPLAGSELALADALKLAIHPAAGSVVVIAAILILLNQQNLEYMGGPRILQALAVDGFATRRARRIGKGGNPVFAIVVTWAVAAVLILVGGFEFLLLLSVFFYIPLYLALIVGVLILRKREPEARRPFRAWGHPYSTIFCLVAWTAVTLFQAYAEREMALYAIAMTAASWPVYRYLTRN
jgi:APA family basic amino acid/polyamine antiporter